jgi:uncharacterized membrane protein
LHCCGPSTVDCGLKQLSKIPQFPLTQFHYIRNVTTSVTTEKLGRYIFALPWLIICVQHFMYADFLTNLVPEYMPFRSFWVYFTGLAMFAAGVSFFFNVKMEWAALGLAVMLLFFIIQLHIPFILSDISSNQKWTRAIQDVSIVAVAIVLSRKTTLLPIARYLYALPLIFFGVQHFLDLKFITAKAPEFLPFPIVWDILIGATFILAGVSIVVKQKMKIMLTTLGALLMLSILLQLPPLLADIRNPLRWVVLMLEMCIASGTFVILASHEQSTKPKTVEETVGEKVA